MRKGYLLRSTYAVNLRASVIECGNYWDGMVTLNRVAVRRLELGPTPTWRSESKACQVLSTIFAEASRGHGLSHQIAVCVIHDLPVAMVLAIKAQVRV